LLDWIHPLLEESLTVSRETFARKHPGPFFVVEPFERAREEQFGTLKKRLGKGADWTYARVAKREGNVYEGMITIGRATNNDVVLPAVVVSKFHAYVTQEGARFYLADAGSSNGTAVNGALLQTRSQKHALENGDRIHFGELKAFFVSTEGLFDWLVARNALIKKSATS
jgi:hypothetical protein